MTRNSGRGSVRTAWVRWAVAGVALLCVAGDGPARPGGPDVLAQAAAGYRVADPGGIEAKRAAEAAIRWSKPSSGIEDAALFFWTAGGRPVAAGTFLRQKGVGLYHEFQSLSAGRLVGESDGLPTWEPRGPGIRFAPAPDAPAPADTRVRRQVQMQAIARDFRAEAFKGPPLYPAEATYPFRLLAKPLIGYADPARPGHDGAVFAFVQETDPEVLLLVEARDGEDRPRWEYALAPMTGWGARASYRGREVWSVPRRHPGSDPRQPYYVAGPFRR